MSPTQRTLKWLRDHNITAQVVEKVVPHNYVKIDLFGCIDIIALIPKTILGIQTTTGDNHAKRITKAREEPRLLDWLKCGGRYEVWSWRKSARTRKWVRRVAKAHLIRGQSNDSQHVEFIEGEETE